ncbi:hypothetical protein ACVWZ8_004693 [Arthrobacter sp. UYCu723]
MLNLCRCASSQLKAACNTAVLLHIRDVTGLLPLHRVLEARGPAAPDTIAAVLLHIRDVTGLLPHLYFTRSGDHRLLSLLPFRIRREGKTARITRELLAAAEPDASKRPRVHDG